MKKQIPNARHNGVLQDSMELGTDVSMTPTMEAAMLNGIVTRGMQKKMKNSM